MIRSVTPARLAARSRDAYDSDIAVARARQYNVVRLTADLERLGDMVGEPLRRAVAPDQRHA
jgi:hypothetical protein